jgi:nitrogen fixation NifU-like protein
MIQGVPEPRLDQLYQDVILDHNRRPRNFKEIAQPTQYSHGVNPLCGDNYHLYLTVDPSGIIQDIGFQGSGCAISKSSASMMTSVVKGKSVQEAENMKECFVQLLTQEQVSDAARQSIGRLTIFEGVKEFPVRVKCATLIWHALADALKDTSHTAGKKGDCDRGCS